MVHLIAKVHTEGGRPVKTYVDEALGADGGHQRVYRNHLVKGYRESVPSKRLYDDFGNHNFFPYDLTAEDDRRTGTVTICCVCWKVYSFWRWRRTTGEMPIGERPQPAVKPTRSCLDMPYILARNWAADIIFVSNLALNGHYDPGSSMRYNHHKYEQLSETELKKNEVSFMLMRSIFGKHSVCQPASRLKPRISSVSCSVAYRLWASVK